MSDEMDISDVIESYKKEEERSGVNKKLTEKNTKKIRKNEEVDDFRAYKDDEENYLFRIGEDFRCNFLVDKEIKTGKLIFSTSNEVKMVIYSRKVTQENGKYKVTFSTGPLLLQESPYFLSLEENGNTLIEGIEIELKKGEKRYGESLVLKDPFTEGEFPEGKFYIFGEADNLVKKFREGEECVTVFHEESDLDLDDLKEEYEKAGIINEKKE